MELEARMGYYLYFAQRQILLQCKEIIYCTFTSRARIVAHHFNLLVTALSRVLQ
jgi:hypothetical protein